MKKAYEDPMIIVVIFSSEDIIAASGDYSGIDFMDLI